jgi:hypothetical protein
VATHLFLCTDRAVRRTLPALGLERAILATDEPTLEDALAYDEVVRLPPSSDVLATLAAVERIAADHVFFQTEFGLLVGSLLASRRGLPGPTPRAAHLCTNKWRSREALAGDGVPVPRHALCRTGDDVRAQALGWPVVLKPLASTLGRGVTRVACDEDLDDAVAALRAFLPGAPDVRRLASFARVSGEDVGCDPTTTFLAEEFAHGPPREADGLVFGDRVDLFGVTEQRVRDASGFYIEAYLLPADEPGRAAEHAVAAVRASRLTDSGFSVELRGDVVIEVNGRLGEDDGFPELFRAALGSYPMEKWLRGDGRPSRAHGAHALAYVNRYEPGVLRHVGAVPPGVVLTAPDGTAIPAASDPAFRPHVAYAIASHPTSSRAALVDAQRRLAGLSLTFGDVVPAGRAGGD